MLTELIEEITDMLLLNGTFSFQVWDTSQLENPPAVYFTGYLDITITVPDEDNLLKAENMVESYFVTIIKKHRPGTTLYTLVTPGNYRFPPGSDHLYVTVVALNTLEDFHE